MSFITYNLKTLNSNVVDCAFLKWHHPWLTCNYSQTDHNLKPKILKLTNEKSVFTNRKQIMSFKIEFVRYDKKYGTLSSFFFVNGIYNFWSVNTHEHFLRTLLSMFMYNTWWYSYKQVSKLILEVIKWKFYRFKYFFVGSLNLRFQENAIMARFFFTSWI